MIVLSTNDVAQQTLVEHGLIGNLVKGLRSALAWEVQEGDFSRKLSTLRFMAQCFHRHLGRLMALEENDGYMDLVAESSPWLSRRVDALRNEHVRLRGAAGRVVQRLEKVSPTDWAEFAGICDDLAGMLHRVEEHTRKEVDLLQEAFDQESGGEG